ncbi:MAG: MMPL family transporter [Acidobacteriota bacterium]|nr:MAG: MMPL family transporter [Acidobacteriota bacterium]
MISLSVAAGRPGILIAFAVATAALSAGHGLGPAAADREPFTLIDHPVFEADARAGEHLGSDTYTLFAFAAGRDERHRGNVLELHVLREILERTDAMLRDSTLAAAFLPQPNPLVGQKESGPQSIAHVAREIMNRRSPLWPWEGPAFVEAQPQDLTRLLDMLFAVQIPNGRGGYSAPYRELVSEDLRREDDGSWFATGMPLLINASRSRIDALIDHGAISDREDFEVRVDQYLREPFETEDVALWSYAGLDRQIDAQIDASLPLVGAAILLMILVIGAARRDAADMLAVGSGLFLLIAWIDGAIAWLGFPATELTSMLPIVLVAVGVDFSIHSLGRFHRLIRSEPERRSPSQEIRSRRADETVRALRPALGLASATTAIAFGTAIVSPIDDLFEWGVLAVIAIGAAYLLLGVLVIHLRSLLPVRLSQRKTDPTSLRAKRITWITRRHWRSILFLCAATSLVAVGLGRPRAGFDVHDYVSSRSRFIRAFTMEKLTFSGAGEPNYLLVEGRQLAEPGVMQALTEVTEGLREIGAKPSLGHTSPGLIDLLRGVVQLGCTQGDAGGLPRDASQAAFCLSEVARSGLSVPGNVGVSLSAEDAAALYEIDQGRLVRARIWFNASRPDDWPSLEDLHRRITELTTPLTRLAGVSVTITGPSFKRFAYVNALTESFGRSTIIALILCALLIVAVMRDVRLAALAMTPVLVISLWLSGTMALAAIDLNVITVQVVSLAIGLGIDYTIHLVEGVRERTNSTSAAARIAALAPTMEETGVALALSALSTILGFLVLLISPMPLFRTFGSIMAMTIALSLLAALTLVPALLAVAARGPFTLNSMSSASERGPSQFPAEASTGDQLRALAEPVHVLAGQRRRTDPS